ncbi:MAG: phosphopantetheine-binding protein [Solirubrobacterales bacterium]
MSDARLVDSVVLDALDSMAAVDGPLALDMQLADVEIDSLDLVELTQILEEESQIGIAANAFADAISVGDVIDAVRSHLT